MSKKKKKPALPSTASTESGTMVPDSSTMVDKPKPAKAKSPAKKVETTAKIATLKVPLMDPPPRGYRKRRIDLQQLTGEQTENLHATLYGLMDQGAKLKNGVHVTTLTHAGKWLLENLTV